LRLDQDELLQSAAKDGIAVTLGAEPIFIQQTRPAEIEQVRIARSDVQVAVLINRV
jgi:hypothetical protein